MNRITTIAALRGRRQPDAEPDRGPGALARTCAVISSIGAAVLLLPTGSACVYHDTCIKVTTPGHDWCGNLAGAVQWPAGGNIDDATPILAGAHPPQGCRCFNDAEHSILDDTVPACKHQLLLAEIEVAARQQCQSLVTAGHDHNCWVDTGPNASVLEGLFSIKAPGRCTGNCEYGNPPASGSCPDPNPYECATGDDGQACDPMDDSTGANMGADSTGEGTTGEGAGASHGRSEGT